MGIWNGGVLLARHASDHVSVLRLWIVQRVQALIQVTQAEAVDSLS